MDSSKIIELSLEVQEQLAFLNNSKALKGNYDYLVENLCEYLGKFGSSNSIQNVVENIKAGNYFKSI